VPYFDGFCSNTSSASVDFQTMSWWGGEDTTATTAASDVQQELEDLRAEHDVVQQSLEMKNNLLKTTQADLKDAIREAKELQAKVCAGT
jgi:hypothetical protein